MHVANFGHVRKVVTDRILRSFSSRFLHRITPMWFQSSFSHVFQNFNFEPKLSILQRLQPMHLMNFGHFQKVVIFRILGVFPSRFLHRTTLMCLQSGFSHVFQNFNFEPKLSILQRLQPMHCDQVWPIFKKLSCFEYQVFFQAAFCTEQL